ncbi:MAG: hypothetical protein H6639_00835 [Caldilineaceae bacterium]|nr:hypothetical protein [Caldilineaceae bacterium]
MWNADATPGRATNTGENDFMPAWLPPPTPDVERPASPPAAFHARTDARPGLRRAPWLHRSGPSAGGAGLGRVALVGAAGPRWQQKDYVVDITGDGVTAGIGVNV